MNPKNLKFLSSRESIPSDISMLDNFDIDHLKRYWKAFKTSSNVLPGGHRLENLFWRMWGSEKLHKTLSGSRIAILFMMIQQGEDAFEKTPRLRIPEFGKAVRTRIQPTARVPPCASLEIPPTPPPSPIESQFPGRVGRPPMSRLPSQGDIAESLHQAVLQLRHIPVRSSPPNPPPPSPATPMASPLLAAVQATSGQTGYFTGSERPGVPSHGDNMMMNINSAAIAPPRNPSRPSNPTRKSSSSTLPVVEEVVSTTPPTTQQKGPKRPESVMLITESTTSSSSAKVGKKAGTGSKPPKKGTLPKGKAKFAAGKKGGLRPALVRQKSSTSSTMVENEEEEEDEGEYDELTETERQIAMQQKLLAGEIGNIEKGPVVDEKQPVQERHSILAEVKKPVMEKVPAQKKPVLEVVSDVAEEGDEFEDEEDPKVAPPPMRRTISAGPVLGGKKSKKGSSARLSKKNRNISTNADRAAPALGIAAIRGGLGKEAEAPAPLPVVSIVEPDFRRKFQERNNITRTTSEDGISVHSGNSSPGSSVSAVDSNGKGKRREKLVFLTSDMEARTVKCQPTVSIATPASSVVVAKKMHGQNVLMVEAGEIKGLNSQRTLVTTRKVEIVNLNTVSMGGSGGAGSGKSALSLMIEDAKRKNGGKVGGGGKGSLGES
ncbi:hypothetical protein EV426DRAFT_570980 [Tirmania nivea]|nr:hypothetical protein EV426DRAFT_570980 [Tirmania nivea]